MIEFQHCKVSVDVISVLLGLFLNVFFEELEVSWVVAKKCISG